MLNIVFGIYIFLSILSILIFADVILSWLSLFGINLRPKFVSSILDPIYTFTRNNIPTTIGVIDFTPVIIIFFVYFLKGLLLTLFPEVHQMVQLYSNIKF